MSRRRLNPIKPAYDPRCWKVRSFNRLLIKATRSVCHQSWPQGLLLRRSRCFILYRWPLRRPGWVGLIVTTHEIRQCVKFTQRVSLRWIHSTSIQVLMARSCWGKESLYRKRHPIYTFYRRCRIYMASNEKGQLSHLCLCIPLPGNDTGWTFHAVMQVRESWIIHVHGSKLYGVK